MQRIYVIANIRRKPDVAPILKQLLPWLRELATIVKVDNGGDGDLSRIKADLVLVFGGDGSILSVARRLHGNPIPVFGVNMGQLGFLAETSPEELRKTLPWVLRGDYVLSSRMMLQIRVANGISGSRKPHSPAEFLALNDAVLLRLPKASMMAVEVRVSGEEVARYKGDGLIVSTATGSTGYSLSAGGPILSERLKAMIVTPICPHTLANRPIVLSGDETLEIRAETRTGSPVELVMDGQVSCSLTSGTVVTVARAPHEFNLVTVGRKGRYEIIRDKLHWAGWVKER
ncbi:MAG TPA: NAD(+)/NADH kinase [Planctomycetota bacterium]|nr:NAD(+)/NADH kinase [Planctomycetota bacterium]